MKLPLLALLAVFCNVGAQLAMKWSGRSSAAADTVAYWFSPWLAAAVLLYGASFLLTVRVVAVNPLSVASPAMAGGSFFLVALASSFLLGEPMGVQKIAGIALIFVGISLLARA